MNFASIKSLIIPEGNVLKITRKSDGAMLWEKITSRIPSDYQEVQYIVNTTGTVENKGYINLGFAFDTAATYIIHYIPSGNAADYIFGAAENSGKLRCMISDSSTQVSVYGTSSSGFMNLPSPDFTHKEPRHFKVEMSKGLLRVTNLLYDSQSSYTAQIEYTMTNNLYLFAQNYNGTTHLAANSVKLMAFSYYDKTGTLICDLVPCYRKSDGVIGMYDIVRKIFLTNAGNGAFAKGANVGRYKNWARYSTESDGVTIYNGGKGYKDGYRIRSGGDEAENEAACCTGFIPFVKGDKMYIHHAFSGGNTDNAINFADASFTNLGQITDAGVGYGICSGHVDSFKTTVINGVSVLDLSNNTVSGVENIAYVRITNKSRVDNIGFGSEMIITVNEEIV